MVIKFTVDPEQKLEFPNWDTCDLSAEVSSVKTAVIFKATRLCIYVFAEDYVHKYTHTNSYTAGMLQVLYYQPYFAKAEFTNTLLYY